MYISCLFNNIICYVLDIIMRKSLFCKERDREFLVPLLRHIPKAFVSIICIYTTVLVPFWSSQSSRRSSCLDVDDVYSQLLLYHCSPSVTEKAYFIFSIYCHENTSL